MPPKPKPVKPTHVVAPIAPSQAITNAQATLATLLAEQTALTTQLATDRAAVTAGWQTLTAPEQTAIVTRMLDAFGTVMEALVATVTAGQMVDS